MANLKLSSFVLFVKDVKKSRKFYEELLDQEIEMDINGINIGYKSGLALWDKTYAQKTILNEEQSGSDNQNNLEIYFETSALDKIWEEIKNSEAKILHEIQIQPWQQRVFRVYDPDNFIVEIAESMAEVVLRLNKSDIPIDEIVKKTFMPQEVVAKILTESN